MMYVFETKGKRENNKYFMMTVIFACSSFWGYANCKHSFKTRLGHRLSRGTGSLG